LRVVGPLSRGGLDERVVPRVEGVEGVAAAVPAVQAVTYAEQPGGAKALVLALGLDCRVEARLGPFGCSSAAVAGAPEWAPAVACSRPSVHGMVCSGPPIRPRWPT